MVTPQELPSVIVPGREPKYNDTEYIGAQIVETKSSFGLLLEDGTIIPPKDLFDWIVGKDVYVSCEYQGQFDILFKYFSPRALKHLATAGICWENNLIVEIRGKGGHFSVRRGNKWGHLSNVDNLYPGIKTPKQVRMALELARMVFESNNFYGLRFRSVGATIQDVSSQLPGSRYQPRADLEVMDSFLKSFRPARMEGIVFGTSDVYDYDIVSAYPALCSKLISTLHMQWVKKAEIIPDATYASIVADVHINERLVRGPIAVPIGYKGTWYPVGRLDAVRLNKPEIDLLLEYPELGTIDKIYSGYWGLPVAKDFHPYKKLIRTLYGMRVRHPELGNYIKLVMAALWGKTIGQYVVIRDPVTGEGHSQASNLYNPAFGSHVTSEIRTSLYRDALGVSVIGEFVDGVTTESPLKLSRFRRLGSLVSKGTGPMTLFNDVRKTSEWKNPGLRDHAWEQRDNYKIEIPTTYYHTLKTTYEQYGEDEMWLYLGKPKEHTDVIRLGSVTRQFVGTRKFRVGDFLERQIRTAPMEPRHMLYALFNAIR